MFSAPIFLSVGDEYDKRDHSNTAKVETPFVVSAKHHPHKLDATFSKFVSLAAGDPYPGSVGGHSTESTFEGSPANRPPFRSPGRSHASSGKGDYYGTFSEKTPYKHETELPFIANAAARGTGADGARLGGRNFYTNRAKKGTYGYTGLTIGQAGEIVYEADPYDGARYNDMLARKQEMNKQMGRPFRPAVKSGGCFDDSEHGFSRVYNLSKPLPPKKQPLPSLGKEGTERKPWVPAGALAAEIAQFPEYQEDPYDLKERKRREERQKERQYEPWCPVTTDRFRYIYTKPIQYDPPQVA